jgi:hypothetical protein
MTGPLSVLDAAQLKRIEAVHRGFLYQHLYAANCLLRAGAANAAEIVVEADEDIEITLPARRIYVQVKTRSDLLSYGDIETAVDRFAQIRQEHTTGARSGTPSFVVAANIAPNGALARRLAASDWPQEVVSLKVV